MKSFLKNQTGSIFILSLISLTVILVGTLAIISGAFTFKQNARYASNTIEATSLAEAGIDKAIASLNKNPSTYSGDNEVSLGPGTFSVTITSIDASNKTIESTGYIPNKSNPKVKRTVKVKVSTGVGASFVYGVQVGEGGLELGNSNTVNGSLYSNGDIIAGNSNTITGDAWVAGGPESIADQETDCSDLSCNDYQFGKNISSENRLDVAQSFQISSANVLSKVSIKIKKSGGLSDATVRIVGDDNGNPNKNNVLATGTLYNSLVTTNYGWTDITFNTTPSLSSNTTYWLMINNPSNQSNFWSWQLDSLQSYTAGQPKWSSNWQAGNPAWTNISGDLSFKIFLDGVPTKIAGGSNFNVQGDVHANTIQGVQVGRDAYFQVITGSTVAGSSYPNSADPPPKVFPLSEANITDWKNQVNVPSLTIDGSIGSCVQTLGPNKIIGDVNFNSNCTVTIQSPIWITGNLTLGSNNVIQLDPSYGTTSGVIIVDGVIELNSNNRLNGTGQGSSLLMALSTFSSQSNNIAAIKVNSSGNSGVLYAGEGIIEPGHNNTFKELTAWGIRIINNSVINYDTGLSSTLFSSGPSGSYNIVKGTYQLK